MVGFRSEQPCNNCKARVNHGDLSNRVTKHSVMLSRRRRGFGNWQPHGESPAATRKDCQGRGSAAHPQLPRNLLSGGAQQNREQGHRQGAPSGDPDEQFSKRRVQADGLKCCVACPMEAPSTCSSLRGCHALGQASCRRKKTPPSTRARAV